MRLLLIEDNAFSVRLTQDRLRRHGYTVDHVKHAGDVLLLEKTDLYDVVVVDRTAHGIDDVIFGKPLHKEGLTPPIVFLTGRSSALDGVNGGGDDYVMKGTSFSKLFALLAELNRSRTWRT